QADIKVNDIIELNGSFFLGGTIITGNNASSYLLKLSKDGKLIKEVLLDSTSSITRLASDGNELVLFRRVYLPDNGRSKIVYTRMDSSFNVLYEKSIMFPEGRYPIYLDIYKTQDSKFFVSGSSEITSTPPPNSGAFLISFDQLGDSIDATYLNPSISNLSRCYGSTEVSNMILLFSSYLPGTNAFGTIRTLDENLAILDTFEIKNQLYDYYSPKVIQDSMVLILSRKHESDFVFVSVISPEGDVVRSVKIGNTSGLNFPAFQNSISLSQNSYYFVTNSDFALSSPFFGAGRPSFVLVGKLNENLDTTWTRTFGGKYYYFAYTITSASNGGCIVAGNVNDTINHHNSRNIFIKQFDSLGECTSTVFYTPQQKKLKIYPNPCQEYFYIEPDDASDRIEEVKIVDIHGRLMMNIQVNTMPTQVNVSQLANGSYIAHIRLNSGRSITRKIIHVSPPE
ncbi:MAG: T9SS type A sorting domain-containing protein, partial [Bacteroidales bacterium]|nr:T9SS type A sorting domain-containing protein [Bacteroidales bacterium]